MRSDRQTLGVNDGAVEVLDELHIGGRRVRRLGLVLTGLVATVAVASWAPAIPPPRGLIVASAGAPAVPTTAAIQQASAPVGGDARAFCQVARNYLTRVQTTAVSLTDRAKVRNLFAGAPAVAQLVTSAPPDVRQDVVLLTEAMTGMQAALEAADHDLNKLSPGTLMTLHSPPVVGAMARLDAWARRAC